jgi:hypothetical protein
LLERTACHILKNSSTTVPRTKLIKAPIIEIRPSLKVSVKANHSDHKAQPRKGTVACIGSQLEKSPNTLKLISNKTVNPNRANAKLVFMFLLKR